MSKRMGTSSVNKTLTIEQVLHGYADGHRLLKASTKLSPELERMMLILSDMSGPSMVPGFENYLTGYPLRELGVYALGRTWYAPEMPRPGCVWTHTLLIPNTDLARIKDLRWLNELFIRPSNSQDSWNTYGSSIIINSSQMDSNKIHGEQSLPKKLIRLSAPILFELYRSRGKSVYLTADHPSAFEELFLLIWSQQWPRLRRSFKFCTGSIADRKLQGKSFDLQIIPPQSHRHLSRDKATGTYLDDMDLASNSLSQPDWVETAVEDLVKGPNNNLREFFRSYGADLNIDRSNYSRLTIIFNLINNVNISTTPISELIQVLSNLFPSPREAARLKAALLGGGSKAFSSIILEVSEADILQELIRTPHYSAFDQKTVGIQQRAKALINEQPVEAYKLLQQITETEISPLGEEFLLGVVDTVEPEKLIEALPLNFGLLEKLIEYNPSLATAPKAWLAPAEAQYSIFAAIEQTIAKERLVPQVVTAMLEAGTDVLADQIITIYGDQAVGAILDWTNRSSSSQQRVGENWTRVLRHKPESLMRWVSTAKDPDPTTITFIIRLLDPHSKDVIAFGADAWLPFVRTAQGRLSESKLIESMAFLLTLGFHNPPSGAAELVASTFETVHGAAAHNKLPDHCWNQLRLQAPTFFFWRTWDRCYLLRIALVEKFAQFGWPTSFFLKAIEEKKTFGSVMDYCEESARGRWFIRKIAEDVFQGRSQAKDWQRKSLSAYYE